jgi:hypothetical protein
VGVVAACAGVHALAGPPGDDITVRTLIDSDIPTLRSWAGASPFPYVDPDSPTVEGIWVLTDDEDRPVMAVMANRLVEIYLLMSEGMTALSTVYALRQLHEVAAEELKRKGYSNAEAFLPPSIERRFGRRLERSFKWVRNWPSWSKSL